MEILGTPESSSFFEKAVFPLPEIPQTIKTFDFLSNLSTAFQNKRLPCAKGAVAEGD
jgi:hypothetical protein